jgi:hypothetical protein
VAGLVVAGAVIGPSAFASGGDAAAPCAGKTAHLSDAAARKLAAAKAAGPSSKAAGPSAGPGPGMFLEAVAGLERAGTINAAQARILDADIRAGSIDPQQLVANGTFSAAQMRAVSDRLVAIKRSLATANGGAPAPGAGQRKGP